ncbi:MAG: cob(I)yrinic acid a,c-diamide adenosyltransferase [Prolixibacteraceae bacterium]|nr:cob(I)yrinic acid a,c-diamide adenosyltransferase [Prolixibacteraceae bacterium]
MNSDRSFKIYTKTGDDGTSGLIGGTRVEKFDDRLEAYGTIDELNSWLGLLRTGQVENEVDEILGFIQHKLFDFGSHLATDQHDGKHTEQSVCEQSAIERIEREIDRMQNQLAELKNFILPGGTSYAAYAHLARTVCRRAERRITLVSKHENVQKNVLVFINRLSDYLFVLARYINLKKGHQETIWFRQKT